MKDPQLILDRTQSLFPSWDLSSSKVEPLLKGGSDRSFFRISGVSHPSVVFVHYQHSKAENQHYVAICSYLRNNSINTPEMLHHEPDNGYIWMQDLGAVDLWSFRDAGWEIRRPLYEKALNQAISLHSAILKSRPEKQGITLQAPFDESLYLWEQNYFIENCLLRHFGLNPSILGPVRAALENMAHYLAGLPRVLLHRDFQSQNIMILNETPHLIDFQGMRYGLGLYDVASLILDPYVSLSETERMHLLTYYQRNANYLSVDTDREFHKLYAQCAAQRLMQALGAYGFLGYTKGRTEFLRHIPIALTRLNEVLGLLPELHELSDLTASLKP